MHSFINKTLLSLEREFLLMDIGSNPLNDNSRIDSNKKKKKKKSKRNRETALNRAKETR